MKLSLKNKYAIQGMVHSGQKSRAIAEALDLKQETVDQYINEELESILNTVVEAQADHSGPKKQQDLSGIVTKTAGDKGGVAVLTPGASSRGDRDNGVDPPYMQKAYTKKQQDKANSVGRTTTGNVFNMNTGEVE